MKKVVLAGGGIACLSVLKSINPKLFDKFYFVLISEHSFHYQTMLLHEYTAGVKKDITHYFDKILNHKNIQIIQSKIISVENGAIVTQEDSIAYDYLILGLGSDKNTFNIRGFENVLDIGNFSNASLVANKLAGSFRNDLLDVSIVICGGGFTGVELAGALSDFIKSQEVKAAIHIIEASERILPMFDKKASLYAKNILESNGVKIHEKTKIIQGVNGGIIIEKDGTTQELLSSNIIWTAGVKGKNVLKNDMFEYINDRIVVDEYCRPINISNNYIFAIGDCAAFKHDGVLLPPTGQLAQKQGEYIAKILEDIANDKSPQKPFKYISKGMVCSLCDRKAIGVVNGKLVFGMKAYLIKKLIDKKWLFKLYGIKSLFI